MQKEHNYIMENDRFSDSKNAGIIREITPVESGSQ